MSDPITLAPEDPRLLQAAFEAKYQTPPERARKIHEITDLLYRWDSGRDKTREELRNGVLDTRNLVERQIKEGRTGWEDSALGAMEVLLAVAKPMSTMGGSGAEAWIESVQDLLKSQLVTDLLQDQRSHNSAAATAQLVEDFGDRLDISVQFLAEALVTDQTGTLRQVVTDLFPEVVGQGPIGRPFTGRHGEGTSGPLRRPVLGRRHQGDRASRQ